MTNQAINVANAISNLMASIKEPLTESQKLALVGALAIYLHKPDPPESADKQTKTSKPKRPSRN